MRPLSTFALTLCLPLAVAAAPAMADCNSGPFSGFYLGSSAGAGISHYKMKSSDPTDPVLSDRDTTFAGSSYAGYNLQCGNVVVGIEGEFGHIGSENKGTITQPGITTNFADKIDWFYTLRGRLGITISGDTLIYATAGLAGADVSHKVDVPALGFSQDDSGWQTGWTVGGGIEFLRRQNWVFRAEALYVDLGSESHTYQLATWCGAACNAKGKWEDDFWVARVGIAYKFGAEPEPYRPLK